MPPRALDATRNGWLAVWCGLTVARRRWNPRAGAVLACLLVACTTNRGVLASKAYQEAGAFARVGRTKTYYVRMGSAGLPAILIHGMAASTFTFRHNLVPLATHRAVYAVDLRGFGASDKPLVGYGLDDFRDQVVGFMDVHGLDRAVLIGSSMGGEVALRVALQHPERVAGLVLMNSAGFMRRQDGPLGPRVVTVAPGVGELVMAPLTLHTRLTRRLMARFLRRIFYDPALVTPDVVEGYYRPLATPAGNRGFLARMRARDWGAEADRIGEISSPTLVLWGRDDQVIPVKHAERFRTALPHAQVIIYPQCGHHAHAELPDEVNRDILAFLATLS